MTPEYLDKVAFKHHGVRKQVEFWRVNHLAEQSLLHTQAHSRGWFSIHRQEAPEFFPGIQGRESWIGSCDFYCFRFPPSLSRWN